MRDASRRDGPVAIVGMGCRFPGGADSPDAYWNLLSGGVDAVKEFPPDRFDVDALFDPDPAAPGKTYSKWGGFLDRVDAFDAGFFGISPREARRMDPQQRLLLEVTWEALEDGGHPPERLAGSNAGVFVGISTHDYLDVQELGRHRERTDGHVNTGTATSIAANRISYLLDAHGPSFSVDTACSSSLTAVHLACRSLAAGECDLAIAGGVGILLAPEVTVAFCKTSMLSPRGRCHAFDAGADGFVRGEGSGALLLKPLDRALADGDRIHAVIRGSAINQDGRTTGLTVPSAAAQRAMIEGALEAARIAPRDVHYVEAHGTGTPVGDPIEAEALGRALSDGRAPDAPCLVGSAKTNIGHLEAAAGIAGLIKATLALKHRQIPPSLHFERPNPAIPFDELGLCVPTRLEPWPDTGLARAGVNSFGFGGANAHVVLEEAPGPGEHARGARAVAASSRPNAGTAPRLGTAPGAEHAAIADRPDDASTHVLTISARSPEALRELARLHRELLRQSDGPSLHDHAYTAAVRRSHHGERLALVAGAREEAAKRLDAFLAGEECTGLAVGGARRQHPPKLAFVFPGMGPQWWGMARQLLTGAPEFRRTVEEVDEILRPLAGWSLLEELGRDEGHSRVANADVAHVANLAVQLGLVARWRTWGIVPDAVVGHSSGEMAAACVSGALTLHDAVALAYHRGRLQHRATGTGRMLAAAIAPEEARRLAEAEDAVALAAVNAPSSVTLAGAEPALERIAEALRAGGRFVRFLPVQVPYHGPQMEAIRDEFLEAARPLRPRPTRIPLVSEVTGARIDGRALDADYWWRNVRHPVEFAAATERLIDDGCDLFVEVGPHPVLAGALAETAAQRGVPATVLPSLRRHEDDERTLLATLAQLHVRGREVDWPGVYASGTCVDLPTYPWQRERYWFDAGDETTAGQARRDGLPTGHPLLGRRLPAPHPTWEASLDGPSAAYLDAHVVQGATVFPGAGYVEAALAAGRELWGEAPVRVEDIRFRKLLFLEPRRGVLQLHYRAGDATVEMHGNQAEEDGSWNLHATARLHREEGARPQRRDLQALRARCSDSFPVEAHYAYFDRRGYDYGPAFRTLEEIWLGDDGALARVAFPEHVAVDVEAYRLHPALLDGVLQLFGAVGARTAEDGEREEAFLPVSIRRVTFHRRPGTRFWAYVEVRGGDTGSVDGVEGDAWLIDDEGEVALGLEGLRMQVLDEAAGAGAARSEGQDMGPSGLHDWLYRLRWEEVPRDAAPAARRLRPAAEVADALRSDGVPPEDGADLRRFVEVAEPKIERIAEGFTLSALERLGWTPERAWAPAEELAEALGVVPQHRRLFENLLDMARARTQEGARALAGVPRDHAALNRLLDEVVAADPRHVEAELLRRGGTHLADILRGATDAREVMLSDDALALMQRFYTDSPPYASYHRVLADAIHAAVAHTGGSAPVRILEIGAGTGAATEAVLPRLPEGSTFTFTDISPYFLEQAQARFGARHDVTFATLNVERDPAAQGFEPHAFDVVFAANVLHATEDLRTTLDHVRTLLADGGILAIMELTRRSRWLNLVFGLLDGWWRYRDSDLRTDGPMLEVGQWRDLLEACGFEGATPLYADASEDRRVQTVQLAHAPVGARPPVSATGEAPSARKAEAVPPQAEAASRRWLVFADGTGIAERVATRLRARGDACTMVRAGSAFRRRPDGAVELPPQDEDAYAQLLAEAPAPDAVLHLWSLAAPDGEDVDAASLMEAQGLGSGSVRALARAVDAAGASLPQTWLVTAGGQAVEGVDGAPRVAQSALWGLGRSLMSEHDAARCRLVDLSPHPTPREAEALAEELLAGVDEDELALRGGARYVRRLRRTSLAEHARADGVRQRSPDADAFRLEIATPGSIHSAVLRDAPEDAPGPGEVAIRVHASGLNFRDVLQALDMLPSSVYAFDRDPGGIGSECAGVVVACGEGVDRFRPGDEVIAMASAAHGSRAITREHLCVAKPDALSFAEAASIPGAFVTAEYALNHVARVAPGERVLIHSATGGVGLSALQVCRRVGAEVLATAGTPEKRDHLRELGVEHVMDSRSLAFADEVLRVTGGEGVDVVLNTLSGEATRKGLAILRPYGRFVELGKRDIAEDAQVGLAPFQRNRSYHAVDLVPMTAERPELMLRLMEDVMRQIADGVLEVVPTTTFDLADAEAALRLMAQAKHIGKVVLTVEAPAYRVHARDEAPPVDPDGTYLITGGLGGFGLAVAGRLARHGAGSLVLMGRSGRSEDGPGALDALRATGTRVCVERGDVADEPDVRRVLDVIRREHPPLKGVFHAAMVLDDDHLARLDRDRFERALAPKLAGAWNLHRLTREDPLDHFVLFSSVTGVMGVPMQTNYAAGNAFLDQLATRRRAQGLPGTSIAWGALADVGYVSRHENVADNLERGGFRSFTPEQALDTLDHLLRHDVDHVMAASMDWRAWAEVNPLWAASERFRHLVPEGEAEAGEAGEEPVATAATRVREAAAGDRRDVVRDYLLAKVARILGASTDEVDPARPFTELGFDSLMAVELVTALRVDLEVKVPVVAILQDASACDLVDRVLSELDLGGEDPGAEVAEPTTESAEAATTAQTRQAAETSEAPGAPEAVPLSFEQRRFWFLDRLHPGTPAYHLSVAARLTGSLDRVALERSLTTVLERHETLRAAVQEDDGAPRQRFLPPEPVPLPVVDLSHLGEADREAELQRRATEEIQRPFDLGRGPLLRVTLFRLAEEEHVALLIVHHIASDAWAMNLLVREVAALYDAYARGGPSPLAAPPASYLDHVERQARWADEAMQAHLAYWMRQLADAPSGPHLALARRAPPPRDRARGRHLRFELSQEATAALRSFAQRERATLFMTLLAAFQTLLHRYSGDEDVCVGTAVSTRSAPGAEAVVGCYLNTLVLRSSLAGDPSFRELLARVRRTTLEAYEHQEAPFDRVIGALGADRDRDGRPPFRAMLVLHNARLPELTLSGLQLEPLQVESGAAVTDLALLLDDGEQLGGMIEFDADRFDADTVETMASHLRMLLEAIPAHAEEALSRLPLQPAEERERALASWNDTRTHRGRHGLLHELIEAQVDRTPEAVAVASEQGDLSYAELDRRANRLAHRLRSLGVSADVPVGVWVPRSAASVVAALGVLKAGGAYLPLDPAHPTERLRALLDEAGASVVVTAQQPPSGLAGEAQVVPVDADEGPLAPHSVQRPERHEGASCEQLAYVMYTSGSTGTPKGIMVPHRAIVNQVLWRQECCPLSPSDAVLQRTPIGFDPSVWELFGPLAAGARVVVPRAGTEGDGAYLVRLVRERGVSVLQATPSVLDALLEQPDIEACTSLTRVFCGGEALAPGLVQRFFARVAAELHHLYGPTEACIDATHWHCRPEDAARAFVPIGRPIANGRAYLLDAHGEPVPVGVTGELYLGGHGVARGYLRRPDLTEETFLADPFAGEEGARMYRTGDLARWWPDGTLEFLGRVDRQVKVRGMRIEPAEVEAVLRAHPAVREAAVVRTDGGAGALTAFVVTDGAARARALREHAASRLPTFMMPAAIHDVASLPRTSSDKIDREALARRAQAPAEPARTLVAPRNDVELRLLRIWEGFFPEQEVGVTDDFFELGGHSLLAMRLLARVHGAFGRELPVASLFEGRTIERQATLLRAPAAPRSSLLAIQPRGDAGPLFLAHPVSGSSVCYGELAHALGQERPLYGLDAVGLVGRDPHERIEDMAAHYLEEVRTVQPDGPYLLGGWSMGAAVAFEMARQLQADGASVAGLIALDGWMPMAAGDDGRDEHGALMAAFARDLGLPPEDLTRAVGEDGEVRPEHRVARVLERARDLNLVPPDLREDELRARLRVFDANVRAMRGYRPRPYPGPLTLLEAEEQIEGVARRGPRWEELARGGVTRLAVPGNHYTALRRPHAQAVAGTLRATFASAESVAS